MFSRFLAVNLLGALVAANAAFAQQPTPPVNAPGTGPATTSPGQVDKDASSVLPSAGTAGPSAAPTMVRDCVKNPQDCTTPPSPGDKATAAGDQSSPPAPK